MTNRKHSFTGVGNRCIYCGAAPLSAGTVDERSCIGHVAEMRPEPVRRTEAVNDFTAIQERMQELRKKPDIATENNIPYC